MPGVFAAGDAVAGPGTVVQSVGHGNLVAQAVDAWLTTGELTEVYVPARSATTSRSSSTWTTTPTPAGPQPVMLSPEERRARGQRFDEVEMVLDERRRPGRVQALPALRPGMARAHRRTAAVSYASSKTAARTAQSHSLVHMAGGTMTVTLTINGSG